MTGIAPTVAALAASLPAPYRIELGGIAEESAQSAASVMAVVPVMLILMLTALMFQLQSFQQLSMVVAVLSCTRFPWTPICVGKPE